MLPLSLLRDYVIYRRLQVLHILMVFLSIYIYPCCINYFNPYLRK
jgi:hypothetical protein